MSEQHIPKEHRDPSSFVFNDDEIKQIEEYMEKITPELIDIDTNLSTDRLKVPGQNYALISFVSSTSRQKSDKLCIKIRGVFSTLEAAQDHAKNLSKVDPSFDILVVSLYEWLLMPPDLSRINDQVYIDEQLNDLISEYRKIQERSHIEFDVRKEALKTNVHTILDKEEENKEEENKEEENKEEENKEEEETI